MHCLPETITCRPEEDLLVCCASVREDEEHTKAIRSLLQQEIDWAYLYQIDDRHRVITQLYELLNTTPDAVPKTA